MPRLDTMRSWVWAERAAFRGSWVATPIYFRLAGSKLVSAFGLLLGVASAVCISNPGDIDRLAPGHGGRVCAGVAILGTLVASFGKGLADRRKSAPHRPDDATPAPPPPPPPTPGL